MEERAYKIWLDAWKRILEGDYYSEHVNNTFEYMLFSLLRGNLGHQVRSDILKHLSKLFNSIKSLEKPPPFIYVLIASKDKGIIYELEELLLLDFITSKASENSVFHIVNFVGTMHEKNMPASNFISAVIKNINVHMDKNMIEALSHIISLQHPEFVGKFVQKFWSFAKQDNSLIRYYVKSHGRKALLELINIAPPNEVKKLVS